MTHIMRFAYHFMVVLIADIVLHVSWTMVTATHVVA